MTPAFVCERRLPLLAETLSLSSAAAYAAPLSPLRRGAASLSSEADFSRARRFLFSQVFEGLGSEYRDFLAPLVADLATSDLATSDLAGGAGKDVSSRFESPSRFEGLPGCGWRAPDRNAALRRFTLGEVFLLCHGTPVSPIVAALFSNIRDVAAGEFFAALAILDDPAYGPEGRGLHVLGAVPRPTYPFDAEDLLPEDMLVDRRGNRLPRRTFGARSRPLGSPGGVHELNAAASGTYPGNGVGADGGRLVGANAGPATATVIRELLKDLVDEPPYVVAGTGRSVPYERGLAMNRFDLISSPWRMGRLYTGVDTSDAEGIPSEYRAAFPFLVRGPGERGVEWGPDAHGAPRDVAPYDETAVATPAGSANSGFERAGATAPCHAALRDGISDRDAWLETLAETDFVGNAVDGLAVAGPEAGLAGPFPVCPPTPESLAAEAANAAAVVGLLERSLPPYRAWRAANRRVPDGEVGPAAPGTAIAGGMSAAQSLSRNERRASEAVAGQAGKHAGRRSGKPGGTVAAPDAAAGDEPEA